MGYARLKGFAHVVIAVGGEPPRAFSGEKAHPFGAHVKKSAAMKELLIQILGISPRVDTSLRHRKTFIEKI